ncbi:MAG: serine/threonine-protein kinase [Leptolyngbyaceae cyanobacterium bins.59]|nr:serine/threonine-protein kinase [Leptolyngbyaceae cyanobacterium bins.59]
MIFNDRYEILRQLAKRSRRMTLLARDLTTQQWVVLKLVCFNSELEVNELRMFEREIRTLHHVSHPAIPEHLDCFELSLQNSQALALVQTYIPGKSLQKYLQAGRIFTEAEAKQIARKLLEVLNYLHRLQPPIIHRDLKPDNILLVEDPQEPLGHIYLIDFGAVSVSASQGSSGDTSIGTYGYMPPEQFGGRAVPASDLYGLGMTLITLLTGNHPAKLPRKNLRVQFEEVVTLSPAFTDWLKWLTEPGLEHRLTSAQEALEALDRNQPRCFKPSVTFRRPMGSRVTLHKAASSLEVFIPAANTGRMVKVCGTIAGMFTLSSLMATLWALQRPFATNVVATLLSLPLWAISIGLLGCVLFTMFGRVRLKINQQQITLIYEFFSWKFNRFKPAPVKTVSKLKYIKPSGGNEAKIHPRILLFAKTQRYELGSNILFNLVNRLGLTNDPKGFGTLTEAELDWLANELSHWLGLPIDQT